MNAPNSVENSLNAQFLIAMWLNPEIDNIIVTISGNVKSTFYDFAWVNIEAGDSFSKIAWEICKWSFGNSQFIEVIDLTCWNFRWPRWFNLKGLPEWFLNTLAPDWIWTKVVLHESLTKEWWIERSAYDIIAMTWDDIARYGWLPLIFTSILDVRSMETKEKEYKQMMLRLWIIAKEQGFIILNWETAELWACVWSPNLKAVSAFNWSWVMAWVYHPDKMIYGDKVEAWNLLVALKQDWFRSNGISAVRKAFELQYWENYCESAPRKELLEASIPSKIYARAVAEANWWYSSDFKAPINMIWIAHLSGGGFKWKLLGDMLWIKWLSVEFDNLFPIPNTVRKVAIWSKKSDKPMKSLEELYSTWCAGQWMI